jgi:hypothetical protein
MADYKQAILANVEAEPLADGFRGFWSMFGRVLDAVRSIKVDLSPADKLQLKVAALAAYDVLCSATDIPILPDASEKSLESWARELLDNAIDRLIAE